MTTETKSTALVIPTSAPLTVSNQLPAYLTGKEASGLESFSREDFNIPQVRLMHPINPEVTQTFKGLAIPGEYWHTGLVKSLGNEFTSIVTVAKKRIILWRPKNDQGGGILAVSNDSINWARGGNSEFTVNLKGRKEPVKWNTRMNVAQSGLLNFGSSNPDDENSQPAATLYYEYILYLPEHDGGSPVVLRINKTGLSTAKGLNAYFLLQKQLRTPIYTHAIKWFVSSKSGAEGEYFVPQFKPIGYVDETTFRIAQEMNKSYSELDLAIEQEADVNENTHGKDEIPY